MPCPWHMHMVTTTTSRAAAQPATSLRLRPPHPGTDRGMVAVRLAERVRCWVGALCTISRCCAMKRHGGWSRMATTGTS